MSRVFVINLERSQDRRDALTKRMVELAIPFEIFPALDGQQLTKRDLANYDDSLVKKKILRSLSLSEIGCYLSHYGIWQKIIEDNIAWATVLEDDIVIGDDLPRILGEIARIPFEWDLIRLSGLNPTRSIELSPISGRHTLNVPLGKSNGAQAYCVSRAGAAKLSKYSRPLPGTVDTSALDCYLEFGLLAMDVRPYVIRENKAFISTIDEDRNSIVDAYKAMKAKPSYEVIAYKVRNSLSKRLNFAYQAFHALKFKLHLAKNSVRQR